MMFLASAISNVIMGSFVSYLAPPMYHSSHLGEWYPRGEFENLLREQYPRMVNVLSVRWGREIAEDAVQEAFIAAWPKWADLRHYDKPVAWLYRVAKQRAARLWKRDQAERALAETLAMSGHQGLAREPNDQPEIVDALAQLPQRQAEVLSLYYLGGYKIGEIARLLDVVEATIRSTMSQGRARLRALLEGQPEAGIRPGGVE